MSEPISPNSTDREFAEAVVRSRQCSVVHVQSNADTGASINGNETDQIEVELGHEAGSVVTLADEIRSYFPEAGVDAAAQTGRVSEPESDVTREREGAGAGVGVASPNPDSITDAKEAETTPRSECGPSGSSIPPQPQYGESGPVSMSMSQAEAEASGRETALIVAPALLHQYRNNTGSSSNSNSLPRS